MARKRAGRVEHERRADPLALRQAAEHASAIGERQMFPSTRKEFPAASRPGR